MHTYSTSEVLIIGGGIIGCSIAYFLRKVGIEVTVVEKAEVGAEASSAAAGLLAPLAELTNSEEHARLVLASWSLFPDTIAEIEEYSGSKVDFSRPGALHIISKMEQNTLQSQLAIAKKSGLEVSWLTRAEASAYEPLLTTSIEGAIFAPQEASIKPELLTKAYAESARKLGARFLEHTEIIDLQASLSRVIAVQTASGEMIPCRQIVIAAGAWAGQLASWLKIDLPVEPRRGQILAVKQLATPLRHILFGEEIYMVPKLDQTIYIGATVEQAGFDKSLTVGGVAWLLSQAMRLAPELKQASIVRMWTGLRPWSPDSSPILGSIPGWENVILATGHSATGVELSPITGQAIAEQIVTGRTPELIAPFTITRFAHPYGEQ